MCIQTGSPPAKAGNTDATEEDRDLQTPARSFSFGANGEKCQCNFKKTALGASAAFTHLRTMENAFSIVYCHATRAMAVL